MRYCIASAIPLFFSLAVFAQDFLPDSLVYEQALNQTINYNNSLATKTSGLYTGSLYVRDYYRVKGHPFFETDSLERGDVFYNGVLYKNVALLYDLSHDNLVTKYAEDANLVLVREKVAYFKLRGHLFVAGSNAVDRGFYDVLYTGKIEILAQRKKELVPWSKSMEFDATFSQMNNYFIYKDSSYYKINSKQELLDALNDKKTALKDFISKNKPDFRKNFEKALLGIVVYYDQITK
ncbi:MAG TPA: hypothetical protein VGQ53_21400 [Chitinophagaceae bacterium]|jgi:hypothetical protein|nr:hypothetical protein [Chitinophagaceae bacterium]